MKKYPIIVIITILHVFVLLTAKGQKYIPDSNLIANGDFMQRDPQQRPLRWIMGTDLQTATLSGEERHSSRKDDFSLKVSDSSASRRVLVRSEKHIANPGTKYMASAWVKTKSGQAAYFTLEFWDQNDKIIASKTATPDAQPAWQQQSIELDAPDKCTHVTASIHTKKEDTGIAYWDDVSLFAEVKYDPELKDGVREIFA